MKIIVFTLPHALLRCFDRRLFHLRKCNKSCLFVGRIFFIADLRAFTSDGDDIRDCKKRNYNERKWDNDGHVLRFLEILTFTRLNASSARRCFIEDQRKK